MAMQLPSSSSLFPSSFTYQVFLSFRGSDTRYSFTGNLYKALTDKGINTFIDDNCLQRGDKITPSLLKAIEESRIFIPVFSINYASSSFCLDELVHIIHCYKTKGRSVLPVFYDVDPTHIRHQTGSYGEHLTKHEEKFQNNMENMERLKQWKMALTQAANLSGYHSSPHGYEYKLIENIVKDISDKINRVFLHVAKYPVGLESRVQQVKLLLDKGSKDEVHMVGLYGTGGMGKSTLAKSIYNFVADQFEGVCFLHNVRENSAHNNLKHLQEELLFKTVTLNIKLGDVCEGIPIIKERLCRKKILLILDDVDKLEQLEALAGGLDWFGRGSRVIITTRDKHLLTCHGIESMHEVEGLYGTEALELLRWMAFKNEKVPSSYEDILNRAVAYASGLPLAIEVVGSNLFGKKIEEWKGTLDGYERIPNRKIYEGSLTNQTVYVGESSSSSSYYNPYQQQPPPPYPYPPYNNNNNYYGYSNPPPYSSFYGSSPPLIAPSSKPPPAPPSPPKTSTWDIRNFFKNDEKYYPQMTQYTPTATPSWDSNVVREVEGIPDLEDEDEVVYFDEDEVVKQVHGDQKLVHPPNSNHSNDHHDHGHLEDEEDESEG